MIKVKKLAASLLALVLILSLAGCGNPQKRITVYGRFQDNYTTDRFDVFCDWETINPLLEECNFEEYGLYKNFFDNDDSFHNHEEQYNSIKVYNFPSVDGIDTDTRVRLNQWDYRPDAELYLQYQDVYDNIYLKRLLR